MTGGAHDLRDRSFLREIGIEPFDLDHVWVTWEQDPEPGFVPPGTLREYLTRYPNGIRDAVGDVAKELGLAVRDGGLDLLAQDSVQMFIDFVAGDLEDIVAMYPFHKPVRPGACGSARFDDYIRMRVAAFIPVALRHGPHDGEKSRNPEDPEKMMLPDVGVEHRPSARKIGLATPPFFLSKPLRLRIIFMRLTPQP